MVMIAMDLTESLANAQRESDESLKVLRGNGFIVDTKQWLTVARYAKKYNVSQQVITNWIGRGIVSSEDTMVLPEFNNLRLVRDQPYK
jgi:hypothetical protein